MEHPENSAEYKGLTVNSGVAQPSIVNPYLKRGRYRHRQMSAGDYVEGILKGDVTVLGRAVTLVESTNPAHQAVAQEVIEKCLPHAGRSIRVGISGVPGAGKSTSIDAFGIHVLQEYGGKLAVLAHNCCSIGTPHSKINDCNSCSRSIRHRTFQPHDRYIKMFGKYFNVFCKVGE